MQIEGPLSHAPVLYMCTLRDKQQAARCAAYGQLADTWRGVFGSCRASSLRFLHPCKAVGASVGFMPQRHRLQELNTAMDRMTALDAWELDANAKIVLERVGIQNPGMKIEAMSGGQARKVAVAAALLGSPDVLILDEPTNHMDVQACSLQPVPHSALSPPLPPAPACHMQAAHPRGSGLLWPTPGWLCHTALEITWTSTSFLAPQHAVSTMRSMQSAPCAAGKQAYSWYV